MLRRFSFLVLLSVLVAACTQTTEVRLGPDGKPLPRVYRIGKESQVQFRMLDSVNSLRQAAGVGPVVLNAELNAAAATHSRDMSVQNRAWHFGSDASSPLDRAIRAGYTGTVLGENISETYETELETLAAWMERPDTRDVILDARAANLGFAWHQDETGKIWWTLLTGSAGIAIASITQG